MNSTAIGVWIVAYKIVGAEEEDAVVDKEMSGVVFAEFTYLIECLASSSSPLLYALLSGGGGISLLRLSAFLAHCCEDAQCKAYELYDG